MRTTVYVDGQPVPTRTVGDPIVPERQQVKAPTFRTLHEHGHLLKRAWPLLLLLVVATAGGVALFLLSQ